MTELFLHLFNISITASYIIIAVLLLRLLIKKFPKNYTCILWGLVGLRLALPFKIESLFSLVPSGETVSPQIFAQEGALPVPFDTGFQEVDTVINPVAADYIANNKTPLETFVFITAIVWLVIVAVMLLIGIVSYFRLKYILRFSVRNELGHYNSEAVKSPFIFGIIKPKIYLPFNINNVDEGIIVSHEKAHINRLDHITKILAYILLSVYWFNPLVWVYYFVLQRDIEAACDQRVIKNMSTEAKQLYSVTLLKYSVNNKFHALTPVAFGEISVKQRIKSVMHYKKPTIWVVIAFVLVAVFMVLAFMTTPIKNNQAESEEPTTSLNTTSVESALENKNSSETKTSSQNVTSQKESSGTATASQNTTSQNTVSKNNTTTSPKNQSNTSSVNEVANVPEKPAFSYAALGKRAEEFLRKNSKYSEPAESIYSYELGQSFYVIPTEILTIIPQYCCLTTVVDGGKEYVSSIDICQYKDYAYASKALEAVKRDLKIIEEFAGMKPTKIIFENVRDNATFENISDIPDDYFKTFSRGSHRVTRMTVYFEDSNEINPRKVVADFECYTSSANWVTGHPNSNRTYNYSVDLYVNYNRDIPEPEYW